MLPVVEPAGRSTFRQTIFFSTLLIGVSVLPVAIGMAGKVYLFGALAMGLGLLATGIVFTRAQSIADARRLLKASVIYLPLLLILIIVDAGF
jgi:protoheme IX farnesyltransferase